MKYIKLILFTFVFTQISYCSENDCIKLLVKISEYDNIMNNMKYTYNNDMTMKQWHKYNRYRTKLNQKKSLFQQFKCTEKYPKLKARYRGIYIDIIDKD